MRSSRPILIKKISGDLEPLSFDKIYNSLMRAGATQLQIDQVIKKLKTKVQNGMSTKDIYKLAYSVLKKEKTNVSYKYKLKTALLGLGPDGFAFEKIIAKVFEAQGYKYKTDLILEGHCVSHEVDVLAEKHNHILLAECKYKNNPENKTDIKTALYVYARYLDLKKGNLIFNDFWLITNTKFTSEALRYSNCTGLKLLGWNYPERGSLQELLYSNNIVPISCLSSINRFQIQSLIKQNIITVSDLKKNLNELEKLSLPRKIIKMAHDEIKIFD